MDAGFDLNKYAVSASRAGGRDDCDQGGGILYWLRYELDERLNRNHMGNDIHTFGDGIVQFARVIMSCQ